MQNQTIECYSNQSKVAIQITEYILITVVPFSYFICGICNLTCVSIFSSSDFHNNIYRYLTASSVVDTLYSFLLVIIPFSQCNVACGWIDDTFQKFVKYTCSFYLLRVLDMLSSLICVAAIIERYLYVTHRRVRRPNLCFCLSLTFFTLYSFLLFIPNLLLTRLSKVEDVFTNVKFLTCDKIKKPIRYIYKKIPNSKLQITSSIFYYSTSIAIIVIMFVITRKLIIELTDIRINMHKIKQYYSRIHCKKAFDESSCADGEKELEISFKSEIPINFANNNNNNTINYDKKTTVLIAWVAVFFIINRIAFDLLFLSLLSLSPYSLYFNISILINFPFGVAFHGSNIINYYKHNTSFADRLNKWMKRLRCC